MRPQTMLSTLVLVALLMAAAYVFAGGPFIVDKVNNTGAAAHWRNNRIVWYGDPKDLSVAGSTNAAVKNAEVMSWIVEEFEKWTSAKLQNKDRESVETVNFTATLGGKFSSAITVDNVASTCLSESSTKTCIIFDTDGSITNSVMYDESAKNQIVGLSMPQIISSDGLTITQGIVILNGYMLSSDTLTPEQFKAAVLHELGHLINLDHAQVNDDIAEGCSIDKENSNTNGDYCNFVPTMYPRLLSTTQDALAYDDIITISWLYPSADFTSDFSTITGEVFDKNGKYIKGVNVVAMQCERTSDDESCPEEASYKDARSMISGAMYPGYLGDGKYYLRGLIPGKKYHVIAEPVNPDYTGASGYEPSDLTKPQGFTASEISTPDGGTTFTAPDGGSTMDMAAKALTVGRCTSSKDCSYSGDDGGSSSSSTSTKCELSPGAPRNVAQALFIALAIVAVAMGRLLVIKKRG